MTSRATLAKLTPMTPSMARLVIDELVSRERPVAPDPSMEELTAREREVLGLLAKGLTYTDVAHALGLGTVQTHVKSIYGKLEVTSKPEAAALATRLGYT